MIREAAAKVKRDQAAQNKIDGLGDKTKRQRELEGQKRLRELKEQKNETTSKRTIATARPLGESDDFSDSDDDAAEDKATGAAPTHSPSPLLSP